MSRFIIASLKRLFPAAKFAWLPLVALAMWLPGSAVWAQLPAAQLNSVFPAGGKQGTTFDVTIGGSDLDDAARLHFSHPGITAVQKMGPAGPLGQPPQPLVNQFTVTIAADVPLGLYEARAIGMYGISTPRAFTVGEQPESNEQEPNNAQAQANEVALNSTVNGVTGGGADIDYFKFTAAKGQRVIVNCWGQRIDSRIDGTLAVFDAKGNELASSRDTNRRDPLVDLAVPADGVYTVKLYDFVYGGGGEYFYRLSIGTGPYIDYVFPPSGPAGQTAKFTLYGRNLPGGAAAEGVKADGRPLEKLVVDIALPSGAAAQQLSISGLIESEDAGMDGFEYRLKGPQGSSNPVLIGFAAAALVEEKEPNNEPKAAQKVTLPCEYVGQFQARGDHDWLTFEAKQGQIYNVEVISKRMGVHTDPQLIVQQVTVNDKGEETVKDLQEADDLAVNNGGVTFDTRSDDPVYRFAVPADGNYRVMICDLYQRGDPRYLYRLSIAPEKPDFRLVAVPQYLPPQNNNRLDPGVAFLRKGGNTAINVVAYRRDGFDGDITLSVTGLPAGVTCPEVILGGGQGSAMLILTAAENAAAWAGTIQVVGKAKVAGADVTREARGGSVIWPPAPGQQNARADSRMTRNIALAVSGGESAPFQFSLAEPKVYEMSRAGKLEIPLKVARRGDFKGAVAVSATNLPPNVRINNFNLDAGKADGKLQFDLPNNAPLGTYTFTLVGTSQVSYSRNPEAVKQAQADKKLIDEALAKLNEEAKKLTQAKTDADKAAADTAAEAKKTADAKAAAEKKSAEAEAASKAAAEKAKNTADANAKAAADKEAADAAAKAKEAADAVTAAAKAAEEAAAKAKAAADAKVAAEKTAAEAAEKVKAGTAAQAAADKRVKDLDAAAKPKNVPVAEPGASVTVKITAAPITVNPPAQPAKVKQGEKVEVPVAITRLYGYADPVEVELEAKGVNGLKIAKVTIPKDQTEAKVTIEAAANATAGTHNLTIKGTAKFNGQNLPAEQTLSLTVEAAPPAEKK